MRFTIHPRAAATRCNPRPAMMGISVHVERGSLDVSAVNEVLRSLRPNSDEVKSEIGTRGDAAYLRLNQPERLDRWAIISTPGDRWFALDVDGGFSLNHFEEETLDDDARRLLEKYVAIGSAYILSGTTPTSVGRCRPRVLRVSTEHGDFELTLSAAAALKEAVGMGRRQP